MHRLHHMRRGLVAWGVLCLVAIGLAGCEDEERFKVPISASKKKPVSRVGRYHVKIKPGSKIKLPRNRTLPLWSEMVDGVNVGVFRSEIVKLQGKRWIRESSSKVYDFYFKQKNHMAARTLVQIANRMAFFVSRWTGKPFEQRIAVVLMPQREPAPLKQAPTPKQPLARDVPAKRAPARPLPQARRPLTTPTPAPQRVVQKPASQPASRPAASRPSSAPAMRPPAKAAPTPTKVPPTPAKVPPTPAKAPPVRRASARMPQPAARPVLVAPRPAVSRRAPQPRQVPVDAGVPDVGTARIVLYTGTTHAPVFSRYGLISALLTHTLRILLTQQTKALRAKMWRASFLPEYFAVRGSGAMTDRSFDRTSTPTFRRYLDRMGRPRKAEALRLLSVYQKGKLPTMLHKQTQQVGMSFISFLEDAYGRGVFAAVFRTCLAKPKRSFRQVVEMVTGQSWKTLWSQWYEYFYEDQWHLVLERRAPLASVPAPAPSKGK